MITALPLLEKIASAYYARHESRSPAIVGNLREKRPSVSLPEVAQVVVNDITAKLSNPNSDSARCSALDVRPTKLRTSKINKHH